jgi:hypothetical protein
MKPMIHREAVVLDGKDQKQISRWIVKTSLLATVMGLNEGDPDRTLGLTMIRRLMVERLPPAQTLIRLFVRDIREDDELVGGTGPRQQAQVQAPPTAFFSISSIGSLGWEMAIGPHWPILKYQSETSEPSGFLQVWPPEEPEVRWPPSTTVTIREINALRTAYLASRKEGTSEPSHLRWGGPGN